MYVYEDKDLELIEASKLIGVKCKDVVVEEFESIKQLGEKMIYHCIENGGLGLAAPQVGVNKNMFVWMNADDSYQIICNPMMFPGKKKTNVIESCLSYPGEHYYLGRYKEVRVKFYFFKDGELKNHSKNLHAERAFVFQHEFDHLQGETIASKGLKLSKKEEDPVEE